MWTNPEILHGLWLLPILLWLILRSIRKRSVAIQSFADPEMARRLMPRSMRGRMWSKAIILLTGISCLILAAARPTYGERIEQNPQSGLDLFVLLDVSRSMLATDVSPSRLERAKSDIRDLLSELQSDRVGLIVFAGQAVTRVPLTRDHEFFLSVLQGISPQSAPLGGSLIGDAIRKSLKVQPTANRKKAIVLITDGEDHDSYPREAAQLAKEQDVTILTIGLGDTLEGARIPQVDKDGSSFMVHDGKEVWSRMDEALLKDIAMSTGGAYIPARTRSYDLGQIYRDHLAGIAHEGELESGKVPIERFQFFLLPGIILLLIDTVLKRTPKNTLGITE